MTASGVGVVAGVDQAGFTATDESTVELCEEVTFGDDPEPRYVGCGNDPDLLELPYDDVAGLLRAADDTSTSPARSSGTARRTTAGAVRDNDACATSSSSARPGP